MFFFSDGARPQQTTAAAGNGAKGRIRTSTTFTLLNQSRTKHDRNEKCRVPLLLDEECGGGHEKWTEPPPR